MSARRRRRTRSIALVAGLLVAAPTAAADGAVVRFDDRALPAAARRVEVGAELRIEQIPLFAGEGDSTLELQRFRVFEPEARIVVHGPDGVRLVVAPADAYFRGEVAGEPGSLAVVAVGGEGGLHGHLLARGRWFEIGPAADGGAAADGGSAAGSGSASASLTGPGWSVRPADDARTASPPVRGDACAADELPDLGALAAAPSAGGGTARPDGIAPDHLRAAQVAVETDWELYQKLGSAAAVTDYVGDLFATASSVYRRDVHTELRIAFLSIWETPDDPFEVPSGFLDALLELGDHWHAAHPAVPRTIVHLLSGRNGLAGGIGYHGVLCSPDVPFMGHWGGGYSLTGAAVDSGTFRDTLIMAHEIGHNFRSHHTHCWNDLPLPGDPPIDQCYSGDVRNDGHPCYSGPTSLPPDGGSIMGYCHLLPGGYGNVTLSLGEEGSFGDHSERVIERMAEHIESVGCLIDLGELIFLDGFESGDTSAWTG